MHIALAIALVLACALPAFAQIPPGPSELRIYAGLHAVAAKGDAEKSLVDLTAKRGAAERAAAELEARSKAEAKAQAEVAVAETRKTSQTSVRLKAERDIAYGPDALQKLDVIWDGKTAGNRPMLVFVHGGGFTGGDKHAPGQFTLPGKFVAGMKLVPDQLFDLLGDLLVNFVFPDRLKLGLYRLFQPATPTGPLSGPNWSAKWTTASYHRKGRVKYPKMVHRLESQ